MITKSSIVNVGIFFGGPSVEHSISIASAKSIVNNIDRERFMPIPIAITKDKHFYLQDENIDNWNIKGEYPSEEVVGGIPITLVSHGGIMLLSPSNIDNSLLYDNTHRFNQSDLRFHEKTIDIALIVMHGSFGEDGTIQSFFESLSIPYTGPRVYTAFLASNKHLLKNLLDEHGVQNSPYITMTAEEIAKLNEADFNPNKVLEKFTFPIFVKPSNCGSSFGVSKVEKEVDLLPALRLACQYDDIVLVEQGIEGRELECGILGDAANEQAVHIGEILLGGSFYDVEQKYSASSNTTSTTSPNVNPITEGNIKSIAQKVYKLIKGTGLGRIDFFLTPKGQIFVNEVTVIPGFVNHDSLYPQLIQASGVSYADLIDSLIQSGFRASAQKGF